MYGKIEDIKSLLYSLRKNFNNSEYTLENIEDRLYEIRSFARKHNCMSSELPSFLEQSREKLKELQSKIISRENIALATKNAKFEYFKITKELSDRRLKYAKELEA